ncbi:MAG: enoyl-[acyl-carrier-protein] reductase FabK [Firmicutes bacterium]|nr:enoyl-[acyl-carrier-protein] reductase FabK [Bacillota bacterium]
MNTAICRLLGIEVPLFQGGMAWLATWELASAVSEAGALGQIGAGNAPPEWVRQQIRKMKETTDRPFGVNIMLMSPHVKEVVQVVVEERVPVVTTGAGNPGVYMEAFRSSGAKVIPVIPSVALAKRLERLGVDAVIAEGTESGGHVGELTTMAIVPQVVDAVDLPVIAAGGIGDGRGMAAALALGAEAVQIGTRFVCAEECIAHPRYKDAIMTADDRATVITGRTTGHPVRAIRNKLTREFEAAEKRGATVEELEALGAGRYPAAAIYGDVERGTILAGQIAGMVKEIMPARDIIDQIVAEAHAMIGKLETLTGLRVGD